MTAEQSPHPRNPATSFGAASAAYNAGRPEYPREAIDWMLPAGARLVADVGAGTGKLSVGLIAAKRTVIAIDPDTQMLASLREQLPEVRTEIGTGEEIPLDDRSVDAVVFGQSWHWVDPEAASLEAGRVLRPGGSLGLIWNIRDLRSAFVRELTDLIHGSNAEQLIVREGPRVHAPFAALEYRSWEWSRSMTVDAVLAMAASRSYLITAEREERERIVEGIRHLMDVHPDVRADGTVDMPYVTHAYRASLIQQD